MKTASLALAFILAVSAGAMGQRKEMDRFIFLDPEDTLQIEFRYSADPRLQMSAPSLASETENRRYRDFVTAFSPLLESVGLPMDYRILERNRQVDKGHPVLRIHAMRWRLNDFGDVEAVIRVTLEAYGEKNVLGSFQTEESSFGRTSSERMDQLYVETMIKSLTAMLPELMKHFDTPTTVGEAISP